MNAALAFAGRVLLAELTVLAALGALLEILRITFTHRKGA